VKVNLLGLFNCRSNRMIKTFSMLGFSYE
jgi:hypothetical protein